MLLLESNFGPRPTTHVGKSFDHMELPWKLNNEVYVEMYCEPQCNQYKVLFHLTGTLNKWIPNVEVHKIGRDEYS